MNEQMTTNDQTDILPSREALHSPVGSNNHYYQAPKSTTNHQFIKQPHHQDSFYHNYQQPFPQPLSSSSPNTHMGGYCDTSLQNTLNESCVALPSAAPSTLNGTRLTDTSNKVDQDTGVPYVVSSYDTQWKFVTPEFMSSDLQKDVELFVHEAHVWKRFYDVENEMIVTKAGRRMFPQLVFSMANLSDHSMYDIQIEFRLANSKKWRYANGIWSETTKIDTAPSRTHFNHIQSPNYGRHWTKGTFNFSKIKISNNTIGNKGHPAPAQTRSRDTVLILLNSLHRYVPMIHVYKLQEEQKQLIASFSVEVAKFFAVTAYQREQVTKLKILYNPFAKAFQKSQHKRHRSALEGGTDFDNDSDSNDEAGDSDSKTIRRNADNSNYHHNYHLDYHHGAVAVSPPYHPYVMQHSHEINHQMRHIHHHSGAMSSYSNQPGYHTNIYAPHHHGYYEQNTYMNQPISNPMCHSFGLQAHQQPASVYSNHPLELPPESFERPDINKRLYASTNAVNTEPKSEVLSNCSNSPTNFSEDHSGVKVFPVTHCNAPLREYHHDRQLWGSTGSKLTEVVASLSPAPLTPESSNSLLCQTSMLTNNISSESELNSFSSLNND